MGWLRFYIKLFHHSLLSQLGYPDGFCCDSRDEHGVVTRELRKTSERGTEDVAGKLHGQRNLNY